MGTRQFPVGLPHERPRTYGSTAAVLAHAAQHARNRILHACEAISWIGSLGLNAPRARTPVFSIKGAEVQDATAGQGEQAAHVLPGQILINGRPPWALAGDTKMKIAWLARFMVTSAVPVPFNTADSAAERAGLKEAFRRGCENAWVRARAGQLDMNTTFEEFLQEADRAFQNAEFAKQEKRSSSSRARDHRASDERFVESVILQAYRVHGVTAKEANRLFPFTSFTP